MAKLTAIKPFTVAQEDPLADEHGAVSAWVEDAIGVRSEHDYYQEVDLKSLPSGQKVLDSKPDQSRRYLLAAVAQVRHWDRMADEVRSQATGDMQRINAHHLPGWAPVWGRRRQAAAVVNALMRRSLPFQALDLIALLEWCNGADSVLPSIDPIGPVTRAPQTVRRGGAR